MRSLNKNRRTIYYALPTGDEPIFDEYGNETGESMPTYGERLELRCNVSSSVGEGIVEAFGNFTSYSRTLCVADNACPLTEGSILWFGVPPDQPHNYIVVRRGDSKNGILYALQEVTVR